MSTSERFILVTGGCGYIGSHTVVDLINNGFTPIILDDNSNSNHRILKRVKKIVNQDLHFIKRSCQDDLSDIFEMYSISGIIHFAAFKAVNESVNSPIKYYDNNLNSLLNVLKFAEKYEVNNIVFSSSCSLYGNLKELPAKENSPLSQPESPYAYTKLICEQILEDYSKSNPKANIISLRYFNPVGAHESGEIGESPINRPNNILPVICNSAETGEYLTVFGEDYETRDGSCIRDYIHVMDLSNAHTKSLEYLLKNHISYDVFNVGSDKGISVFELIYAFERENRIRVNFQIGPRRKGDIIAVYSDSSKANSKLGWFANRTINDIVKSAWKWHNNKIS
jgi:UDP-glucose 4-epimerase